ncbi:MAG: hypothetical protein ACK55I_40205, partial [bacterium]
MSGPSAGGVDPAEIDCRGRIVRHGDAPWLGEDHHQHPSGDLRHPVRLQAVCLPHCGVGALGEASPAVDSGGIAVQRPAH